MVSVNMSSGAAGDVRAWDGAAKDESAALEIRAGGEW